MELSSCSKWSVMNSLNIFSKEKKKMDNSIMNYLLMSIVFKGAMNPWTLDNRKNSDAYIDYLS